MFFAAQCVDNQGVYPLDGSDGAFGEGFAVGDIGQLSHFESEYMEFPVHHVKRHDFKGTYLKRMARGDFMDVKCGNSRIGVAFETVGYA